MSGSLTQGRWRWAYVAAWLLVLTIYAAAFLAGGFPLGYAFRGSLANVLPDFFLGLLVLRLPRRARSLAAHAGLLIAFLVASTAGWIALVALDELATTEAALRVRVRVRRLPAAPFLPCHNRT